MNPRYQEPSQANGRSWPGPGSALRQVWREGYPLSALRADVMAGLVVGVVALPLSMALAIACNVPPQYGLYTAIVAGAVAALTGGSRTSVTGPTAAFVVVLLPIVSQYGLPGLLLATNMAGVIMIAMGLARMGRLIQFIPYPVTTGFTAGIAVVIATLQVKDFLGLHVEHMPQEYIERVEVLFKALPSTHGPDVLIGVLTLALLIAWPKLVTRKVPAALIALTVATVVGWLLSRTVEGFEIATIGGRFSYTATDGTTASGIPQLPPLLQWPWRVPGADGQPLSLSFPLIRDLLGPAFTIAMLGAIESLLCAVVADGMIGSKHDPDGELIGQGLGNLVGPFFGGFAATGAVARTATNIRAGGRTPIAALVHALFVLASVLILAPLLSYLPLAALAALLLVVAWNMSEARHFIRMLRVAPRSDVAVLLTCFGLTVLMDMVIAVGAGVILAALLFMQRMSALSSTKLVEGHHPRMLAPLPEGVVLYEVAGPLFFGAAEKAAGALATAGERASVVILDLAGVPVIDATGLVALESAIKKLQSAGVMVVLADCNAQPMDVMQKAGIHDIPHKLAVCKTLSEAEMLVRLVVHDKLASN
ncbi:MAG: C4-dicarboxylic acid transporter DauA [Phycisphaerales bacterium]